MPEQDSETTKNYVERLEKELLQYKQRELQVLTMGDTVSDGVLIVDPGGKIIGMNSVYLHWLQKTEDEILNQDISILQDVIFDANASVLKSRKSFSSVVVEENTRKNLLLTCAPFYDNNKEFFCAITVLRDMSELIDLNFRLEKLEHAKKMADHEIESLKRNLLRTSLVGESRAIKKVVSIIAEVSKTDVTVLIEGETGTGKEIVANEIFKNSLRAEKPYIKINCAAIPESLLESELFGYVKGSFTGALGKDKQGLLETANTGTILLDEIGEMPLHLQAKLLRVIQEKEILKIGATAPIKVDMRIITATNQDLGKLVEENKFRKDLYYRLNVVKITVPPIRERKGDIGVLSNSILERFNKKYGKNKSLDLNALFEIEQYDWPGNVRELENVIERLILFGDNTWIRREDVAEIINVTKNNAFFNNDAKESDLPSDPVINFKETVSKFERKILKDALDKHGSTRKAAAALGMSQPTFIRRLGQQNSVKTPSEPEGREMYPKNSMRPLK